MNIEEPGSAPNHNFGFGCVNHFGTSSFEDLDGNTFRMDCKTEIKEFNFNIDIPRHCDKLLTLKNTLTPRLQNDLDLIVSDDVDTEKHGNMDDGNGYDRKNDVEQVVRKNVDIQRYDHRLSARRPSSAIWKESGYGKVSAGNSQIA